MELERATLTNLRSLESLTVPWNPERYALSRRSELATADVLGSAISPVQGLAGGREEFRTDLLLDASRRPPGERDLLALVRKLERWMDRAADEPLPTTVLFSWAAFRFRGALVGLDQVWVRFDPDGTPTRGWLRLTMRKTGG